MFSTQGVPNGGGIGDGSFHFNGFFIFPSTFALKEKFDSPKLSLSNELVELAFGPIDWDSFVLVRLACPLPG